MKCLESLSYSNCNDALLGDLVPILCHLLLSRRADSSTALVLRVLCNMVANDCYDSHALECGLVPCMLLFLPQHKVEVESQAARDTQCLALRVLSSLSSSPAFDSVFCSSGMTQVGVVHKKSHPAFTSLPPQALSNCFQVGERVSCELASRILRNMSIHSECASQPQAYFTRLYCCFATSSHSFHPQQSFSLAACSFCCRRIHQALACSPFR